MIGYAIGAAVGFYFLRGKTAQLSEFKPELAKSAAKVICDEFGDLPNASAQQMAKAIAEAAYTVDNTGKPVELNWPPMLLATKSHKAVWKQLVIWCEVVRTNADEAGVTPCQYLADPEEPLPTIPGWLDILDPGEMPDGGGGGVEFGGGGLAPGPDTSPGNAMPSPPMATPVPGQAYQIQAGDTLLNVVAEAYTLTPNQRLEASRRVSDHPINRTGEVKIFFPNPSSNEYPWYPNGRISFGAPFQVFYLPTVAELGML